MKVRNVAAMAVLSWSVVAASDASPSVDGEGTDGAYADAPSPSAQLDPNAPPATPNQAPKVNLPPDLAEVVRLAESGLSDDVILAFIQRSSGTSPITADQIVYLRDLGISSQVLQTLVERRPPAQGPPAEPAMPPPVPPAVTPPGAQSATMPPPGTDPNAPPPAPATSDYTYYSDSLAPYGTWLDVPGYGWCWQPTVVVVNPSWQPYCQDGYWVWSDCGWYWNSYYTWGWAPFHYGRWCRYPAYGWIWCPDRVWGPAWVCWRQAPGYCGWAPLPPGARFTAGAGWTFNGHAVSQNFGFGLAASSFTFVGYSHFSGRHPFDNRLSAPEASAVFNRTTVNNNLVIAANGRVINRGISTQSIEAVTRKPIRQVSVRDLATTQRPVSAAGALWMGTSPRTANASPASPQNGTRWNGGPATPNLASPARGELQPVAPSMPVYSAPKYGPAPARGGYSAPQNSQSHP